MSILTAVRRSAFALVAAGVVALYLRVKGGESSPPLEGGWRELSGPDLR